MFSVPTSTIAILLQRKGLFNFHLIVHYSRKVSTTRYDRFLGKIHKSDAINQLTFEEEEEMWTSFEKSNTFMDALEEEHKKARIRKFKTIERKYFKPPQDMTLLTWDAKEQIRYLHNEFPEEWPIERLAESFPISEEGVVKLLRSKYYPRSLQQVIKHDRAVQGNWLKLTSGKEKDGPIALRYERLLADGKIKSLQFAAGNFALPMPEKKMIASNTKETDTTGVFASIVKDYVSQKQQKLKEIDRSQNQVESREAARTENIEKLSKITGIAQYKLDKKQSISNKLGYSKMFKFSDNNMTEENETNLFKDRKNMLIDSNLKCEEVIDPCNNTQEDSMPPRKPLRRRRNTLIKKDVDLNESTVSMSGNSVPQKENRRDMQEVHDKVPKVEKQNRLFDDKDESFEYDYPGRQEKSYSENEAEIMDSDIKYQYSFGKVDPTTTDIEKIPEENTDKDPDKLYKKGSSYYDVDGEFLYKVP